MNLTQSRYKHLTPEQRVQASKFSADMWKATFGLHEAMKETIAGMAKQQETINASLFDMAESARSITKSYKFLEVIKPSLNPDFLKSITTVTKCLNTNNLISPVSMPGEVRRIPQSEYFYQKPVEFSGVRQLERRFDKLEKGIDILNAHIVSTPLELDEVSDFEFHLEGLYLTYKGKRTGKLSASEMVLCQILFSKPAGHSFLTEDLENIFYPEVQASKVYKQENLKKIIDRFNTKIRTKTGIDKLVAYTKIYTTRKM